MLLRDRGLYHFVRFGLALSWGISSLSVSCSAFLSSRSAGKPAKCVIPSTILQQEKRVKEVDSEPPYSSNRRNVVKAACLAPLVFLPLPAFSDTATTTEVQPDLNCLIDLPPVAEDHVRIYLCRHGQTENNRLRKVQGARVDPPININGSRQATNLGKALSKANPRPKVFFSSNLQRARMTAQIASSEVDASISVQPLGTLAEVDFGPVAEGMPLGLAKAGMEATYAKWAIGNIDYRPTKGGDSARDVLTRAVESLNILTEEAKASNGCVAAVSHSTFLRILLGLVLDESLLESATRKVQNGGVTVIDVPRKTKTRSLGSKPKLLGGPLSQAPRDFKLDVPVCKVIRINESRHLPEI